MYKESIPILLVEGMCLVGEMTRPRWSAQRRLEFIEFRLYWEGRVNRSDLTDFFGISVPQASADLTTYQQMAEGNMVYDKTAKAYVAGPRFVPVFFVPSADRYLAELQLLDTGLLSSEESRVGRLPAHSVLPNPCGVGWTHGRSVTCSTPFAPAHPSKSDINLSLGLSRPGEG